MTPERWQEISDALDQALQHGGPQRASYLAELSAKDPDLCREVESLLVSHHEADADFLKTPAPQVLLTSEPPEPRPALLGRRIGVYEIVERIGEGGMGEVYHAIRADDQFRKQVAIKVVRGGRDSGFVLNRFRNERQILASLDHPNIARLLDGGTTEDGVPYFVMELIEGVPIDQYCERHNLATADRLKLFVSVCSAVQYAHQRLIVHRDLKPGNILVTGDGTPKLLDFGIAKILDTDEIQGEFQPTLTVFRALTPGYASPEQIKGEPITTATDVYSLGVILYELLTGRSPYRVTSRSSQELARAVCDSEPERPSTAVRKSDPGRKQAGDRAAEVVPVPYERLSKRLTGDLDNIILMALRKEPSRRYVSVEQFAQDVQRHLQDLPVLARKDTARYRASKFIARHRAGVGAVAAIALILIAALVVTFREARIAQRQAEVARQQRARAERRFNDVRKLANSLMFEVHDSIVDLPGSTDARKLLVSRALEYLDSLSQEAGGDPSLQRELAAAYDKVGDVLGYNGQANLGDYAGAAQSYGKALSIRESLAAASPADQEIQGELVDEYFRTAGVQQNNGDFDGALRTLRRAQPFLQTIAAGRPDLRMQDRMAGIDYFTGSVLEKKRDSVGALASYRQGAAIREPAAADPKASIFVRAHQVADYNGIAKMAGELGQFDEAIRMAAKATGLMKRLSEANPTNATFREWLAESYDIWADQLVGKGDLGAALPLERSAHDIFVDLRRADPSNRLAADNLAFNDLAVERILVRQGKLNEGIQLARAAVDAFHARKAKDLWYATGASSAYYDLGTAYVGLSDRAASSTEKVAHLREARSYFQNALDLWKNLPQSAHQDAMGHDQKTLIDKAVADCETKLRELPAKARR